MKKPSIEIMLGRHSSGGGEPPPDSEPDMDGGEGEYGSDAEDAACQELAEILGVPEDKHEDFKSALDALIEAKMRK
jgi:hypothetical protein